MLNFPFEVNMKFEIQINKPRNKWRKTTSNTFPSPLLFTDSAENGEIKQKGNLYYIYPNCFIARCWLPNLY